MNLSRNGAHAPSYLFAAIAIFVSCGAASAQSPKAITQDQRPDATPSQNVETVLSSHGSQLTGLFLLAAGAQPHRTILLLHGFPGYEQNMDLAQSLRRDGWNVLAVHYRGSWGAGGAFSFSHCIEDIGAMLGYLTLPANAAKFHIDTRKIAVAGHSMGGFLTMVAMAQHPEFAAGVVITEGSPIEDGPGFFGSASDPADYVPLAGTSPAQLEADAKANAAAWSFAALAPKIAPRPVFVLSANDGLRASNEKLRASLTKAGSPVAYTHMDTDHGFSDHRIALETAILEWLDKTVPASPAR